MSKLVFTLLVISLSAGFAMTQTPKQPDPKDVSTLDGILHAVYDVISGDAGTPRNWDRLRGLFHKDARLIPSSKNPQTGVFTSRVLTPEDYITRVEPVFAKEGFYEREKARTVETYGNIAHVFSTYESRRSSKDEKPFARGINSFQLVNDGTRWWVLSIFWQAETPDNPIPKKYLENGMGTAVDIEALTRD